MDLAIHVSQNSDWQVVTLKGELDDYQSRKLTQTFNQLIEDSQSKNIVLNLDEVSFVDSVGLGIIAIAGKKLREQTGHLHIVCTHDKILKMVNMSGIISATKETIKLFDSVESAIR